MRVYFDSHAHLDDRRFDGDRADVLRQMAEQRITGMMNVGCSWESSLRSVALAEEHAFIYAAVGSHPDAADEVDEAMLDRYRALVASHPKIHAVGEIGLDYHYENIPRAVQQRAFRLQLELARELGLPAIIHEREAHGDALCILADFPDVTGVFHCYSGAWEMAQLLLKRGWYLGFTGVITFKNARRAVEVVENAPLHRLLIETDCPYMAPEPFRGQRSDPSMVPRMAAKIAEIKGVTPEEAGRVTAENARRLFRIDPEHS